MTDVDRYAITVRFVSIDGQKWWQATVRELPDLAEFGETREEAIELALDAIEALKRAAIEEGRHFPEPIEEEEEHSGRVTLRMPKTLHRDVARAAEQEDVSINSYIVTALSKALASGGHTFSVARGWPSTSCSAFAAGIPSIGRTSDSDYAQQVAYVMGGSGLIKVVSIQGANVTRSSGASEPVQFLEPNKSVPRSLSSIRRKVAAERR